MCSTPDIFIHDEFNPEDTAMMQALYSRSPKSVEEHAERVKEASSGKFMEKFYVQYGHKSIADCGSTTIFIEGVSMLADKTIQDWPLYSGQETSTRYIDMSSQLIVDPVGTTESKKILDDWMNFYNSHQEAVKAHLREQHPKQASDNETTYEKAVQARTFDIMRGFLPAGITTQLSWHTNLRQAQDKLELMIHHPLEEVRNTSEKILEKLKEKYPSSFSHEPRREQEEYRKYIMENYNYYNPEKPPQDFSYQSSISTDELDKYKDLIQKRPPKTNLPYNLSNAGQVTFDFQLDFGSFRDIQRHRNGVCRMPLLTTELGFNEWYLKQLPEQVRTKAENLIQTQKEKINSLDTSPEVKQYYIGMGFNVSCKNTYSLPALVYLIELRSAKAVHPTLRKIAHRMDSALREIYSDIVLHSDLEPSNWDVGRGDQDIIEK